MDKRSRQFLSSRLLDTTTTALVLTAIYQYPQWFNPWQLPAWQWMLGGLIVRALITLYDHLVVVALHLWKAPLLPTRLVPDKPVRFVPLDATSLLYLTINSVHEWLFVQRFCYYMWHSTLVAKLPQDLNLWNTIGCLYVMFIVNDACYAPLHHILHMPWMYPLIHKHHHRQHFPTRGYLDAGNEHPIEHVIGVLCVWAATLAAVHTTGAHAATLFLFFNIHAALAMLNHSPYDVTFTILGITYSVGHHEMHHRKFTVNYAQYCLWYDRIMQTFASYEGPNNIKPKNNGATTSKNNNHAATTTTTNGGDQTIS